MCGQYTYHSRKEALAIAQSGNIRVELEEKDFSGMPYINVCDFRQLKPELPSIDPKDVDTGIEIVKTQHFLDPHVSHTLGNYVDAHFAELGIVDIKVST